MFGVFLGFRHWRCRYPYITILSANVSRRSSEVTGLVSVEDTKEAFGVYFRSKTHYNRIFLKRVKGNFSDA